MLHSYHTLAITISASIFPGEKVDFSQINETMSGELTPLPLLSSEISVQSICFYSPISSFSTYYFSHYWRHFICRKLHIPIGIPYTVCTVNLTIPRKIICLGDALLSLNLKRLGILMPRAIRVMLHLPPRLASPFSRLL